MIKYKNNVGLKTFLFAIFVSSLIFVPYIISGSGIFTYMGDFDAQQIPFYYHCHQMVRSGSFFWDWGTELGTNFIGSYTYYTLCSPFFWLTIPFPDVAVPYLMAPLFILKFGCAALTGYLFIKRFTKSKEAASIGSFLYAFSGWSLYNIFFNQFHESLIVFPLLLLSLEALVNEKKKGVFAIAVFVSAFTNYYFFFGMVIFVVLYWLIKTVSKSWKMSFKMFLTILIEGLLGTLMAAAVLIPTAITVFSMSRMNDYMSGWDLIVYPVQRYFYILQSLFFSPELPAVPSFFSDADSRWSSVSLFLPFVGPIAVMTFIKNNKKNWITYLLGASFIVAMIPVLNGTFGLLKTQYYARWFFMPVLIMAVASAIAIDNYEIKEFKVPVLINAVVVFLYTIIVGFFPHKTNGKLIFGFYNRADALRPIIMAFFCILAFLMILLQVQGFVTKKRKNQPAINYKKYILICISFCAVLTSVFSISIGHHTNAYNVSNQVKYNISGNVEKIINDDSEYRINNITDSRNYTMTMSNKMSVCAFQSIVSGSTSDFYEILGYNRNVASINCMSNTAYNALMSVKYFIVEKNYVDTYDKTWKNETASADYVPVKDVFSRYGYSLNPNTELLGDYSIEKEKYYIYKNNNYIPFGSAYEYYITESEIEKINEENRSYILLNALVIKDSDVKKYNNILKHYSEELYTNKTFSEKSLSDICEKKAADCCSDFTINKNQFSAKYNANCDKSIFFSIPYEDGWHAYINGKETKINVVDGGLMAVNVSKGNNNIVFKYNTPGLFVGLSISAFAFICLLSYITINRFLTKKNI